MLAGCVVRVPCVVPLAFLLSPVRVTDVLSGKKPARANSEFTRVKIRCPVGGAYLVFVSYDFVLGHFLGVSDCLLLSRNLDSLFDVQRLLGEHF